MASTSSGSGRVLLERVTARVFCHGPGGGNPVTVFSSPLPLSSTTQERLAKSCEWESVMVTPLAGKLIHNMAFYMPSGEAVSFCAHAALGGAFANNSTTDPTGDSTGNAARNEFIFQSPMLGDKKQSILISELDSENSGIARLNMTAPFEEAPVSQTPALYRLLRGHLGIGAEHLVNTGKQYPTMVNSSIARPKTLVYVNSTQALHQAKQPTVVLGTSDSNQQRNSFARACDAIDQSTGIYLYATKEDEADAWECRQFPRASGYPEDPATGIAAAALAGSLYKQGIYLPLYKFYQGRAMQRPSLLEVLDFQMSDQKSVRFTLQGRVEVDSRETMDIEEEDNED